MQKMYALVFFLSVVLVAAPCYSQIKKGMRMAGATVGTVFYNSGKSDYSYPPPTTGFTSNNSNYGLSLSPSMGWFISDNTAAGVSLLFSFSKSKITDVSAGNGNTFNKDNSNRFNTGLGGFARNYFKNDGKMLPFGQFNLNFGTGSSGSKGFTFSGADKNSYDGKSSGDFFVNAGLSLGFTKMLNTNTGLDFFAGYNYSYNKSDFKKITRVDEGNNGSIERTFENNPAQKFTNHGAVIGISFQIFLDKRK
jgi:hypothetical protein